MGERAVLPCGKRPSPSSEVQSAAEKEDHAPLHEIWGRIVTTAVDQQLDSRGVLRCKELYEYSIQSCIAVLFSKFKGSMLDKRAVLLNR